MAKRKTVCVDFDGVIHAYTSPWKNARTIPDMPVAGAIDWLCNMIQEYDIAIVSSRSHQWGGISAMKAWLKKHSGNQWYGSLFVGLEEVTFPKVKPSAVIYIDDRAWRFEGAFPTEFEIESAIPWYKKDKTND